MGQVLSNVIENALRHTPTGSVIRIGLEQSADGTLLSIADNGPGIPQTERQSVLQRLYRLDRSRNTAGYGLGLSLVDAVVKLHGAELTLADAAPGLRVILRFPLV